MSSVLAILVVLTTIRFAFFSPSEVSADSLIKFDEGYGTTVSDANGNISGTITGASWQTNDLCFDEKCLFFDGSDWISFGDDVDLDFAASTDFTLEFWFRHAPATAAETIIQKYEATGVDGGYRIRMESDGDISFGVDDANGDFADDNITSTAANYDDNRWHHVAAVKDGTTSITLYIDGVQVAQDTTIGSTGTLANDDTFYIGDSDGTDNGDEFIGFIDEVKIYTTTARTQAEINADVLGATPDRGTSASFGPDQSYLSDGLVGYWKMDEASWTNDCSTTSVTDSSGNGNNGAACPNTTGPTGGAAGRFGRAGNFDGGTGDDYASVADADDLDITGPITISAWINADSLTTGNDENRIVLKGSGSHNGNLYTLDIKDNLLFFSLHRESRSGAADCVDGQSFKCVYGSTTITTSTWLHIAATYDGNSLRVFLNGAQDGSHASIVSTGAANANALEIGGRNAGGSDMFDGTIDETRIYNRALSPAEIADLYNFAPGPVGYWKLDESSGTRNDSSGSDNPLGVTGTVDSVVGKFGKASNFPDGTNDMLSITDASQTNLDITGPITISGWIKPTAAVDFSGDYYTLAAKALEKDVSDTDLGYWCGIRDATGFKATMRLSNDGTTWTNLQGTTTSLSLNTWYHISCVYDGTNMRLYVNGTEEISSSYSSGIFNNTGDFAIGGTDYTGGGGVIYDSKADIDDVRIYNYARTSEQIVEDMNAGHPAPGSPVGSAFIHYKFDEGYGGTTNDSGTSGINGDLSVTNTCPGNSDCPSWTNSGKFGRALSFDGSDDDMQTVSTVNFGSSVVSASFWLYADSYDNTDRNVLELSSDFNNNSPTFYVNPSHSSGQFEIAIHDGSNGANYRTERIDRPSASTWHHYVVVFDNSTATGDVKIYVDGSEQSTTVAFNSKTGGGNFKTDTIYLMNRGGTADFFPGDIDELKFYTFELTEDQVKQLYNQGSAAVFGATSTDSSGTGTWDATNEYCPPRSSGTCAAPILEYKFDEKTGTTANDTSENNNPGTLTNSPTWAKGKYGAALSFDGNNAYVNGQSPTNLDDLHDGAFSVELWLRWNGDTAGLDNAIRKGLSTTGWELRRRSNNSTLQAFVEAATTDAESRGNTSLTANEWTHVVMTFDDAGDRKIRIYINGVEDTYSTQTAADGAVVSDAADDFRVGDSSDTWNGRIDNVRIYNYVRSQEQISWSFNSGGPVGWWKMDDNVSGDAQTIRDSSGKGNDGTTENGANGTGMDCTVQGKRNLACDFDGTDDYVTVANDEAFDFGDGEVFTVTAWVKLGSDNPARVMAKNDSWELSYNAGNDWFAFGENGAAGSDAIQCSASGAVQVGVWYYISAQHHQAGGAKCRMNVGVEFSRLGFVPLENVNNLDIGRHDGGNYFDGQIDEVQIYNYVLTDQQLRNLYNSGAVNFGY